jgi:streptogramin lyase
MKLLPPFACLGLVAVLVFPAASTMQTAAGTGKGGYRGDGGPATLAELDQPFHCELGMLGPEPVLYVAEAGNHCIRRVNLKTGIITTIAGTGKKGYTGDGGDARLATMNEPYAVVGDAEGNLFIADRLNAVVRRIDGKRGTMTTLAGAGKKDYAGDGGKASEAMLREPNDVCLDGHGGVLIADVADWRIRRVDLKTGIITTFAGIGKQAGKIDRQKIGDGGPANQAVIVGARAVCTDGQGNTYICEREGNAIRKVDAAGQITTWAGTGVKGYAGDGGPAAKATFNGPKAIRCDQAGNLFIVDTENHAIRRIDAKTGAISTVAGGKKGKDGDGGDALQAELDRPHGCIVDSAGTLYIADSNNHRVRKVMPSSRN